MCFSTWGPIAENPRIDELQGNCIDAKKDRPVL